MISKNLPAEIRQIWKEIERLRARAGGHFVADSVAVELAQDAVGNILTDTTTVNFTYDDGTPTISADVIQSAIDHGSIAGLNDDDHTLYALLAGRSGGQTLYGGTASGETLTLNATSDATQGRLYVGAATGSLVVIGPSAEQVNADAASVHKGLYLQRHETTTAGAFFRCYRSRGTASAREYLVASDVIFDLRGYAWARNSTNTADQYIDCAGIIISYGTPDAQNRASGSVRFATRLNSGTLTARVAFSHHGLLIKDGVSNTDIDALDTNARAIVCIYNGTAPTTSPTDSTQLYSADLAAGNAGLHVRSETGAIHKFGSYTVLPGVIRPASDSTTALQLATAGGTPVLNVDTTNGRVGINNPTPLDLLDMIGDGVVGRHSLRTYASSATAGAELTMWRARGTFASPTQVKSGDVLGGYYFRAYGNTNFTGPFYNIAALRLTAEEDITDTSAPSRFSFELAKSGENIRSVAAMLHSNRAWRLNLAHSAPAAVANAVFYYVADHVAGDAGLVVLSETGAVHHFASRYVTPSDIEFSEISDPAAPATNKARLFARDDGSGKTQLCVRFSSGAVQVLATEP